jgi:hypothetical protein
VNDNFGNEMTVFDELSRRLGKKPHAIVRFADGDLVVVVVTEDILGHSVEQLQLWAGDTVPCVKVEPGRFEPFSERGVVEAMTCSDELACLVSIADFYNGTWHEFKEYQEV